MIPNTSSQHQSTDSGLTHFQHACRRNIPSRRLSRSNVTYDRANRLELDV